MHGFWLLFGLVLIPGTAPRDLLPLLRFPHRVDTPPGLAHRAPDGAPYIMLFLEDGTRMVLDRNRLRIYRYAGDAPVPTDSLDLMPAPHWASEPAVVFAVRDTAVVLLATEPKTRGLVLAHIPAHGRPVRRELPQQGFVHALACTPLYCAAWYTDTTGQPRLLRWMDPRNIRLNTLSSPLAGLHAGRKGIWGWTHHAVLYIPKNNPPQWKGSVHEGTLLLVTDRFLVSARGRRLQNGTWHLLNVAVQTHTGEVLRRWREVTKIDEVGDTLRIALPDGTVRVFP